MQGTSRPRGRNSHCLIVSSSSFLDNGTMGRWDYATSRPTGGKNFLIVSFSHFLIVFFLDYGTMRRWDYGTMGRWDYGTMRPTNNLARPQPSLRTHRSPRGAPPNVRSFVRQHTQSTIIYYAVFSRSMSPSAMMLPLRIARPIRMRAASNDIDMSFIMRCTST